MGKEQRHPVLSGVLALIGVAVAIGLVLGGVALGATKVLGLGGGDEGSGTAKRSMYIPSPSPTEADETDTADAEATPSTTPSEKPKKNKLPKAQIVLRTGASSVAPMETINLTGTDKKGAGVAILQVQRQVGGQWEDFYGIDAGVQDDGTYATYIETGRPGKQKFRMRDLDDGRTSNTVTVTVG